MHTPLMQRTLCPTDCSTNRHITALAAVLRGGAALNAWTVCVQHT